MQLRELQPLFGAAAVADNAMFLAEAIHADAISANERVNVYHENIVGGLVDVLGDIYAATRKLVGDEFFAQMARAYVPQHLPVRGDLNTYGEEFPAFIANYNAANSVLYLADVARFEWLWHCAYFAADDKALSPQELQIPAEKYLQLRLSLRNSTTLLAVNYPVDDIWRYCEAGGDAPETAAGPVYLLIARPEFEVVTLRLSEAEYRFLSACAAGETLERAADVGADISESLAHYFRLGIFKTR